MNSIFRKSTVILSLLIALSSPLMHAQNLSTTSSQPEYVVYGPNNERELYTFEELTKIAKKGHIGAQFTLGSIYRRGTKIVESDIMKAIEWYKKAAEQGHADAQVYLGDTYLELAEQQYIKTGKNGYKSLKTKDIEKYKSLAKKWYKMSAGQGHGYAMYRLGIYYLYEERRDRTDTEVHDLIKMSAEKGYSGALYEMGRYYEEKSDWDRALEWFHKAQENGMDLTEHLQRLYTKVYGTVAEGKYRHKAETGDPVAQYELGQCYYFGKDGVEENKTEAFNWTKKSAENGYAAAQRQLAIYYSWGTGTKKDIREERKWNMIAAENGEPSAQFIVALYYLYGEGEIKKNYEEAVKRLKVCDAQGNLSAKKYLGDCYFHGLGVDQDYSTAFRLYLDVHEGGHHGSRYMLGKCYYYGYGVKQDYAEAVKFFNMALDPGKFTYLGLSYYYGYGIEQDYNEATRYLNQVLRKWGIPEEFTSKTIQEIFINSAEKSDANTQYELAEDYYNIQDYISAAQWYKKAAEKGHSKAAEAYSRVDEIINPKPVKADEAPVHNANNDDDEINYNEKLSIAVAMAYNYYSTEDYEACFTCLLIPYVEGIGLAQLLMGHLYMFGHGVEQNLTEAFQSYSLAAEQRTPGSFVPLAHCYYYGIGCKANTSKAYEILMIGIEEGDEYAIQEIKELFPEDI